MKCRSKETKRIAEILPFTDAVKALKKYKVIANRKLNRELGIFV